MSSPEPGGRPRPLRLAGLALVAVALVAAAAGLITVIIDGDDDGTAAPPPSTSATSTGQPESPPSATPTGPSAASSAPTSSATPPAASPSTSAASPAPPPPPAPPPATALPVRVYNNSTITGLAARAASDFRGAGWRVEEVGNYPGGIIPTSTVYFRPGTDEEAAARTLGNRFDLRIEPRFPGIDQASPGLIVIVTNDYGGK